MFQIQLTERGLLRKNTVWNVTFDHDQWVAGRADMKGQTHIADTLENVMALINAEMMVVVMERHHHLPIFNTLRTK